MFHKLDVCIFESAKMATSKMRKIFRNLFRILDVVIFALSHLTLTHFRPAPHRLIITTFVVSQYSILSIWYKVVRKYTTANINVYIHSKLLKRVTYLYFLAFSTYNPHSSLPLNNKLCVKWKVGNSKI